MTSGNSSNGTYYRLAKDETKNVYIFESSVDLLNWRPGREVAVINDGSNGYSPVVYVPDDPENEKVLYYLAIKRASDGQIIVSETSRPFQASKPRALFNTYDIVCVLDFERKYKVPWFQYVEVTQSNIDNAEQINPLRKFILRIKLKLIGL